MNQALNDQLVESWQKVMTRYGNAAAIAVQTQDDLAEYSFTNTPGLRYETASTVKVAVLALLLHTTGGRLDDKQRELTRRMIRNSDNKATTAILENYLGGIMALKTIYPALGMTKTTASTWWGTTLTVPHDQLKLLKMIYLDPSSTYLDNQSRNYIKMLMKTINPQQQWGISAGNPADFYLKNGWRQASDNKKWEVHSIGFLPKGDRSFLIAIYTRNNRNFNSGVSYVEELARATSKIVFK